MSALAKRGGARAGRARKAGARYSNGRLKPERLGPGSPLKDTPRIGLSQALALRRYERDLETSFKPSFGRLEAAQRLALARTVLNDADRAAIEFMSTRGVNVKVLAARTGREPGDLAAIFASACWKLAKHYASVEE